MLVTKFIPTVLTVTPVLLLMGTGSLSSSAQVAHPLQVSTINGKQFEHEFTPPKDSAPGDGLITTSTGTFFTPPRDSRRLSGPVISGGARSGGCLGITETAFTAFGPQDDELIVGQTVSSHPEFVWHLPESENTFPVIFRILAPNEENIPAAIFEERLDYTPGFVNYQLPQTEAALTPGVNYRWQVVIECNPAYPSRDLVQELPFEVVAPTATLSQALSMATTSTQIALAYGQEGIWYDAIAQVAQATTTADQQTRGGLLSDLVNNINGPQSDQLQQDILTIVQTSTP